MAQSTEEERLFRFRPLLNAAEDIVALLAQTEHKAHLQLAVIGGLARWYHIGDTRGTYVSFSSWNAPSSH